MNYKKILLSVLFLIAGLMAQNPLQDPMLDSAMHAMHNLDYEQSLYLLNKLNDNVYAPMGRLLVEWYQVMGLYGNDFNKKILIKKCDDLVDYYKKELEKKPKDPDLNFCMALAMGFKSRIMISEKNPFFVMFNGVNSLKYLRRVDELSSTNPDLEFCKGVFEYYISKYPGVVKYFANLLLETTGDRETGRKRIHLAAKSKGFLKYDANFLLAFLYLYIENKPTLASDYINRLVFDFPKNPNYHFLKVFCELQKNNVEQADCYFKNYKAVINPDNPYYLEEFLNREDFLQAMIFMRNSSFEQANHFFEKFLLNYELELEHLKAIALLEQGKIQLNYGNKKVAKKLFKSVIEIGNNTYPIFEAKHHLERLDDQKR